MSMNTEKLLQEIVDRQGPLGNARMAHEHESAMTSDAVAGLIVRPTTVSLITIFNGESPGGKSLVMDRLFGFNLVTTAAQTMFSLWYCNHTELLNVAKPANDIITLRGTGDGREPDLGTVRVEVDGTVVDDGWFPCGNWVKAKRSAFYPAPLLSGNAVAGLSYGRRRLSV